MRPTYSKKKQLTIIGTIFGAIVLAVVVIAIIVNLSSKNEYGDGLKIQNYNQKVKNTSTVMRNSIEATLYNVVKKNVSENTDLLKVGDAFIRDDSNIQNYDEPSNIYTGNFIVDIESIKQSYYVQYTYVKDTDNDEGLANRVVINCVEEKDLKFGTFECTDFVAEQAGKNDSIIQYLPFSNFSFHIAADTTAGDDNLVLHVELRIPESDLKGDLASKQNIVVLYKNEVAQWLKAKDFIPTDYTFEYNYTDNGDYIAPAHIDNLTE
jgi:hypothetical protein